MDASWAKARAERKMISGGAWCSFAIYVCMFHGRRVAWGGGWWQGGWQFWGGIAPILTFSLKGEERRGGRWSLRRSLRQAQDRLRVSGRRPAGRPYEGCGKGVGAGLKPAPTGMAWEGMDSRFHGNDGRGLAGLPGWGGIDYLGGGDGGGGYDEGLAVLNLDCAHRLGGVLAR